ncbi:MAG: DUF1361 domain-containing protein [Microcoleaceae cyanobacterium]|jgi:uncharacterized membrane protein
MKTEILPWITLAWEAISEHHYWMSWNLFLGLFPLAISIWLFRPRYPRWFLWILGILLGLTLWPSLYHVIAFVHHLIRDVGKTYLLGAGVITLSLMALDIFRVRQGGNRSLRWWIGFLIFILFLPNAPYVLTDVIHLYDDIRLNNYSVWILTLVLVPQYLLFMLTGFEAYVLSLISLNHYLKMQGWGKWIFPAEVITHALCAIGIYLGRFIRFNTWDVVLNPDALVNTVMNDLVGKGPFLVMVITFVVIASLYFIMKWITFGALYQWPGIISSSPLSSPDSSSRHS